MNELVLKMLEGEPRVYLAPIGWISYEEWFQFPTDEWYHRLLEEVEKVKEQAESEWRAHLGFKQGRTIVCCEGEPPGAE